MTASLKPEKRDDLESRLLARATSRLSGVSESALVNEAADEILLLRAALYKYGHHLPTCTGDWQKGECSCGYLKARQGR